MSKAAARNGLVALAVLAAAYGGATWYVGVKAEPAVRKQVEHFNHSLAPLLEDGGEVSLRISQYQRHWFSSNIDYELYVDDGEEQQFLLFTDRLRHGPFPVAAVLNGHLTPLLAYSELTLQPSPSVQPWFEATQGQSPFTVKNALAFDGAVSGTVDFAPASYHSDFLGDRAEVEFTGAQLSYHIPSSKNSGLLSTRLHYQMGDMRVDGHAIGGMELNLELQRWDQEVLALLSQSERVDALSEAELQPYLVQLLKPQPEFRLWPLGWKNAAGESFIKADVLFANAAADAAAVVSEDVDLAQLFERLNVEVQLSRPMLQGFFAQDSFMSNLTDMLFMQMLRQWEQAGLVVYDGSNASFKLLYEPSTNQLLLNDQPVDPEDLLYAWLLLTMMGS